MRRQELFRLSFGSVAGPSCGRGCLSLNSVLVFGSRCAGGSDFDS